jgi:hypothetical protein
MTEASVGPRGFKSLDVGGLVVASSGDGTVAEGRVTAVMAGVF